MAGTVIITEGPIFDGRAELALPVIAYLIREAVANTALNDIHAVLPQVLQHPTGAYESRIVTDLSQVDVAKVWDQGDVKGPWLEGSSRRNKTTRFKGYRTFRKVTQGLKQGRAAATATAVLAMEMGRIG
jgi:hypothetical protein